MTIQRREFLAAAAAAGIGGILGRQASAAPPPLPYVGISPEPSPSPPNELEGGGKDAVLKLSSQEGVMAGKDLAEKLDNMEELGFVGIEVWGGGLPGRVEELRKALSGRKIRVSAICAGFDGWLIADDPAVREKAVKSTKQILTAAGALESTGMIVVPAFNNQKSLPHKEARALLVDLLKDLGEHAAKAGTRVLLEPLNRGEAHFLRQVPDAAAIARDVASPGVAVMGDFWHMTFEETSDLGAFISAGDALRHVHIASRKTRQIPTMDEGDNYVLGFKGLKWIGYQDYVSLECGGPRDAAERKKVIAACVKLLRAQWDEA